MKNAKVDENLARALWEDLRLDCLIDNKMADGMALKPKVKMNAAELTVLSDHSNVELYKRTGDLEEDLVEDNEADQQRAIRITDELLLVGWNCSLITVKLNINSTPVISTEEVFVFTDFIQSIKKTSRYICIQHNSSRYTRFSIFTWSLCDGSIQLVKTARLKLRQSDGIKFVIIGDLVWLLFSSGSLFKWHFTKISSGSLTDIKFMHEPELNVYETGAQDLIQFGMSGLLMVNSRQIKYYRAGKVKLVCEIDANILAVCVLGKKVAVLTAQSQVLCYGDVLTAPIVKWRMGLAVSQTASFTSASLEPLLIDGEEFLLAGVITKNDDYQVRRFYCLGEGFVPLEVPSLGSYSQKMVEQANVKEELLDELFLTQVVTLSNGRLVQFNLGITFMTSLMLGDDVTTWPELDLSLVHAVRSFCRDMEPERLLPKVPSQPTIVSEGRLNELNALQFKLGQVKFKTTDRSELNETLGVSGMRRRLGRVLRETWVTPQNGLEAIVMQNGASAGQIKALYDAIIDEEKLCQILAEKKRTRRAKALNRSRFELSLTGAKVDETALTVKESTPEPSSDEERAVPAFRPRVRLKRGRPPKRRIHSPLVELTNEPVNETVDETMNETMNETANLSIVAAGGDFHVESKPQQKLLSNSQRAKVKKKRKSRLGF